MITKEQASKLQRLVTRAIIASESEAIGRATGRAAPSWLFGEQQSLDDAKKALTEFIASITEK